MRETRFYSYLPESAVSSSNVYSIHPITPWNHATDYLAPELGPPVRSAGLAGFFSWRVVDGNNIVLEHVVQCTGLRVAFPGPLSCAPVVSVGETRTSLRLIAAFATEAGSEIVCLDITTGESAPQIRKAQAAIDADVVSALCDAGEACIFGLASGRCGNAIRARAGDNLYIKMFDVPEGAGLQSHTEDDDINSHNSDISRRSITGTATTQQTPGLLSRLFQTSRNPFATPATTARDHRSPFATPRPSSTRSNRGSINPFGATPRTTRRANAQHGPSPAEERVEALANLQVEETCLVALHANGRIVAFLAGRDGEFRYAGETNLGLKLAKNFARQSLLETGDQHLAAVLTVDEDPQADSVRVFAVGLKWQIGRTVVITCRQLVKRSGPIEKVVDAVVLGNDVIVATETGVISGPMQSTDPDDKGVGLPNCVFWTAVDDVEHQAGLGNCINSILEDPMERLLCAHRFSVDVISKALRLNDLPTTNRGALEKRIRELDFGDEKNAAFAKAQARAEFLMVDMDLPLRGLQMIPGVGLVAARNCGLFVFRQLLVDEKGTLGREMPEFAEYNQLTGPIACLAASHGSAQVFCAQLARMSRTDQSFDPQQFLVHQTLRFSQVERHYALTDRLVIQRAQELHSATEEGAMTDVTYFVHAVQHVQQTLAPGSTSLRYLFDAGETAALSKAADISGDIVPVSCMFASGLWWLEELIQLKETMGEDIHTLTGTDAMQDVNDSDDYEDASRPNAKIMLEKSYGFLVGAARLASSSDGPQQDDIECVTHLANIPRNAMRKEEDEMRDEIRPDSPVSGMEDDPVRDELGYWLLERTVRLFEKAGSPKSAAAAALEAMKLAPSRDLYETMRAAAFGRFLDARNLPTALEAMLKPPFNHLEAPSISKSEASALRDGMGLFVNAVADGGMLRWLVERNLPEPLTSLTAHTLARRARAAEPLDIDAELGAMFAEDEEQLQTLKRRLRSEYETLYAWYIRNQNEPGAAGAALEWGERLQGEGLRQVLQASVGHLQVPPYEAQLRLLMTWANTKGKAFSCAHAAVQLLPEGRQYFVRSRFSVAGQEKETDGIVDAEWAARRNLLARTQSVCIARLLSSESADEKAERASFLFAAGLQCLSDGLQGVQWVIETICGDPTLDNIRDAVELAAAWTEELGPHVLEAVVSSAARTAVLGNDKFDWACLSVILEDASMFSEKNWPLVALKATCQAQGNPPQWLVDAAARRDGAAVARAFLAAGRPVHSAQVLLAQYAIGGKSAGVAYSAIDATIMKLKMSAESEAQRYREELMKKVAGQLEMLKLEDEGRKENWANGAVIC